MSKLREALKKRKGAHALHSISCIPGMISDLPLDFAEKVFNKIVSPANNIKKVSIVDPFIIPKDINILTTFFGGYSNISLEIISKFEAVSSDDNKEGRKEKLRKISDHLVDNGLFKDISYIHSTEKMHDRYYIFWKENEDKIIISVGGSVAQTFSTHNHMIEINDKYLELCIMKYYSLLTEKIKESF